MSATNELTTVQVVPPVTFTCYALSGRVLGTWTFNEPPGGIDIPKDIRKRIARTTTVDARGVMVDEWFADWAVEES